jgi:DNA segregation ATPase FtsK/SpoIIIE, S-DNA-T family
VRFLTPTGNKRLNELIGFLCIVLGLLVSAALFTYSPTDNSFNVAAHAPDGNPSHNFIGPIGAYGSDLLFQGIGYAAFLLPIALLTVGWKWFRSRAVESQVATLIGYGLLVISIPTLLTLIPFPDVRGAIPAGGMSGHLLAGVLSAGLNKGAYLVAGALFVTALFLTTSFSFSGTHAWAVSPTGPIGAAQKLGILQKAQARWHAWKEDREQQRMRRKVEANRKKQFNLGMKAMFFVA